MAGPTQKMTIACSAEELEEKLSSAQKALGLTYDKYGRLTNAQGQFVGGLSQARIKMGDYIDAQGRMRDMLGHYLDGLTATQQKLRMYRDEIGNLYTAEGELVEQVQAATAAQDQQSDAAQRGMQALMGGAKGAAKMANNLSLMIGVLGGGNEGLNKFGQNVVIATQSFSQFALAMKTLPKFVQGFKLLTQATKGQTAAQVLLNAVSGNWVALVAGGLAAGTLAYKTLSSATKKAAEVTTEHKEETAELIRKLDALGIKIKEIGAEQAGFRNWGKSETAGIEEARAALAKYDEETEQALKKYQDYHKKHGQVGEADELYEKYQSMKEHRADKEAEIAQQINMMVGKDLDFTDEMTQLQQRAAYYQEVLDKGNLSGEELANAQQALANNLKKQEEISQKQADELARKEGFGDVLKEKPKGLFETFDTVDDAAKRLAEIYGEESEKYKSLMKDVRAAFEERAAQISKENKEKAQKELDSSGFDKYVRQTDEELENFNKTIETWKANAEAAGVSTDDLNAAIQNYTDEFNQKRNEQGIADLGLDQYLKDPEQTPLEKYNEVFEKVREAEEKFGLDKERANQILLAAEQEYADSLQEKAEEEEQKKESRLNELGITGLREKRKTDEDKLLEQQTKIAQAVEEGLISTREANDLNNDLMQEYLEKFGGKEEEEAGEETQKEEKVGGTNSSMTLGSQSLYQALISQRDDPYKSEVKQRMTELSKTQENTYTKIESLEAAVTGYLERLQEKL